MASEPPAWELWGLPEPDDQMTLEDAITTLSPGIHFNFGSNIEARRKYYQRREKALHMVAEAGYFVRQEGFGYRVKPH